MDVRGMGAFIRLALLCFLTSFPPPPFECRVGMVWWHAGLGGHGLGRYRKCSCGSGDNFGKSMLTLYRSARCQRQKTGRKCRAGDSRLRTDDMY